MTLHINYDHQCASCSAEYVPYDEKILCPNCGNFEPDRYDFIPEAIESLKFNRSAGSYIPGAWLVESISDHILNLLFYLFAAHEKSESEDFRHFSVDWLSSLDWEDQDYLCGYMIQLAARVYTALDGETTADPVGNTEESSES